MQDKLEATVSQQHALELLTPAPAGNVGGSITDSGEFEFLQQQAHIMMMLRSHMQQRIYAVGEYMMKRGNPGDSLVLIEDGEVEVSVTDDDGNKKVIETCGEFSLLGEMSLLTDEPQSADVVALTEVEAFVMSAETFHKLARNVPAVSMVLTHLVAMRLGRISHDALSGKTFDGFQIIRRIGLGGMSVVYEAKEKATSRHVALKMMSHRLVYDTTAFALFQREADIIEAFDHDNIVRVLGRFAGFRTFFIVMEYCEGSTFERHIRKNGPLMESEARGVLGQLASALNYAHSKDVVHRDMKLSNVILTSSGIVKLMDFGLAKPLGDSALDKLNPVVGTPRHMAPEQFTGRDVGKAADYFGFGCCAYRMLTGKWLLSTADVEQLARANSEWRPPQIERLCPGISSELCELIQRCVEPDPANRDIDFQTVMTWSAPIDPSA